MAPDFGNFPQQITAISAAGIFVSLAGLLTKLLLGKGQLSIAAQKVAVEAKQVANAQEADIRDHYAGELAAWRGERAQDRADALKVESHLREMIELSDRRHEECEAARVEDRKARAKMQDEIDGLKRQIPITSADMLLMLEQGTKPSDAAPLAVAAAKRLKEGGDGK